MKKILLILAFPFIANGQILKEAKENSILGKDFYNMKVETEPTDFRSMRERQDREQRFRKEQSYYERLNQLNQDRKVVQPTNRFYTETDNTGKVTGYYQIDSNNRIIKRNSQGQIITIIE